MTRKSIIRTCDDFGLHFQLNRSILGKCHDKKINLVSCVVNNIEEFSSSFDTLRNTEILKALHLNVTEGRALSTHNKFWLNKKGNFRFGYRTLFLWSILIPKETQKFLLKEFHDQLETFLIYFEPKAILINSHNHILSLPASRKSLNKLIGKRRVLVRGNKCYNMKGNSVFARNHQRLKKIIYNIFNEGLNDENPRYCHQILQIDWEWKLVSKRVSEISARLEKIESQQSNLEIIFHLGIDDKNCYETTNRQFRKLRYLSYYSHHGRKVENSLLNVLSKVSEIGGRFDENQGTSLN